MMKNTIALIILLLWTFQINAQENENEKEELTNEEMAEKLANPNAAIGTFNTFTDFYTYKGDLPGANDQNALSFTIQPSLPKPNFVGKQMLFFRPSIPILFNPKLYDPLNENFDNGGINLGDIGYDLALGGTTEKGLLYLFGMSGTIPTATDSRIRGQWTLGPELVLGLVTKKIIFGGLVSQRWDLESGPVKTSVLGGQYFYAIPLSKGNVIGAGPSWSYNWNTEDVTFPIGTGWTKTTKVGKTPFKFGFQVMYYIAQPNPFGPQWQLRIQLTPVLKLPW